MEPATNDSIQRGKRVVVSVGGSLIVPDAIDTDFLIRFKALILDKVKEGFTFSIIAFFLIRNMIRLKKVKNLHKKD